MNKILIVTTISAAIISVITLIVYLLFNWVVTVIFGLPRITLIQAFGLYLLVRVLAYTPTVTFKR